VRHQAPQTPFEVLLKRCAAGKVGERDIRGSCRTDDFCKITDFVDIILNGDEAVERPSKDAARKHLASFFTGAKVREVTPLPPSSEQFRARVAMSIFRASSHLLRRPFDYSEDSTWGTLQSREAQHTMKVRIIQCMSVLFSLAQVCPLMCIRLADDVDFLDRVLCVVAKFTDPKHAVRNDYHEGFAYLSMISDGLMLLNRVTVPQPKLFASRLQRNLRSGGRNYFLDDILPYISRKRQTAPETGDMRTHSLVDGFQSAWDRVWATFFPEHMREFGNNDDRFIEAYYEFPVGAKETLRAELESCDYCRAEPEPGTKLLRCGACKVARYCSRDHQLAA